MSAGTGTRPGRRAHALLLALLVTACGHEAPPALTVGPVAFTKDELLGLSHSRVETLADLSAFGLAVADSTATGLGAPVVQEWTNDRRLEILAADLTLEKHAVDDAGLEADYRADPEWELTVQHILVFSERWRDAAHRRAADAKATEALAMLKDGQDFPDVEAALAAEGAPEARQGVLPAGREGAWVPEFWAAAVALEPGELSPVTETEYGYHVLRLLDRKVVPFEEARSVVARRVAQTLEDPRGVLEDWMRANGTDEASRRAAGLEEADRRGIEVPEPERAELQRRWDDQVAGWAAQLGFAYGLGPAGVGRAALAALGRSGQTADIARRELAERSALFRAPYPVALGTQPSKGP